MRYQTCEKQLVRARKRRAATSEPASATMKRLLIANRGEIAIRIAHTASLMGLATVAVYSADDASSLHRRRCDEAVELPGVGAAAYLNGEAIIAAAMENGCDA